MEKEFVAINYITCQPEYVQRFEELFSTRARAIDRLPGFRRMQVLKPRDPQGKYLVISWWDSEMHFRAWTRSPEFLEGHRRGFDDLAKAKAEGKTPPMVSEFCCYEVLTE
ncbi:MAG: antibiotic biosynthesis monooxygenase [Flavobacteriales bacterium]|nr:antibiotic biosynthesis monooxygenase [Flavobacteriales bacterium]MCX7767806.1 antibiotic biosynthesis monooxygenase [Flavobacteriales bacterium]MDW8409793.1 antibiotic biosynthesis monooxygenase [Flavobacteriales bacterium]